MGQSAGGLGSNTRSVHLLPAMRHWGHSFTFSEPHSFLFNMGITEGPTFLGLLWGLNRLMHAWGLAQSLAQEVIRLYWFSITFVTWRG